MQCARCHAENRDSARFCRECGATFPLVCVGCGATLEPGSRFCDTCGTPVAAAPRPDDTASRFRTPETYTPNHLAERILTSRAALEGERKQVTVLFVDVSGFTALSARLDPEDVHSLMTHAFELMLGEVHRYEGTVNQFLGDGIMALFGAPLAHEDHAQRAVQAALGIRRALDDYQRALSRDRGLTFQVRQGLNSGLVVVGSIGNDLRMDYTAVGDTTNVAARLLQAAAPGQIVIAETTYRLAGDYFDVRELGALTLKGKTQAVHAWAVEAARPGRTRLEAGAQRGLTPLVAREREIGGLVDALDRARGGKGQVVFIVGEPGIGKSRLLHEFRERADDADWREGHCVSFGSTTAFHPLVDLVKRWAGIGDRDTDEEAAAKVESALGDELRSSVPYLRYLLSLGAPDPQVAALDPRQRRRGIFEALQQMILRAARARAQIVVIEDLHWIDRATEESLVALADSVPASRVLLVLTYRPGYAQPFGERTYYTRIVPAPLSEPDSARMVTALLAGDAPEPLRRTIAAKAEGNPFYVEEVVRSLREAGALGAEAGLAARPGRLGEIEIPDTIHDVIMARIDRLDEAPKRLLQTASVIGRDFTRRLVERLAEAPDRSDALLRELGRAELIHEKQVFPEVAYTFKHALTQDVAYQSLLVQRRRELHRQVGAAIEQLYADRLPEQYDVLAHHHAMAEDWRRAFDYYVKAAEKAGEAFALRDALALYDHALAAADHLGAALPVSGRMAVHRAKTNQAFAVGLYDLARAEGERWLALAEQAGDREAVAAALAQTSFVTMWAQDFPAAERYAERAIEAGEAAGAEAAVAGGYLTIGYVRSLSGRHDEGGTKFEQALTRSRQAGDVPREVLTLQMVGIFDGWHGDYERGRRAADEALRLARDQGLFVLYMRGLWTRGMVLTSLGEWDVALQTLGEGAALAEKIGDLAFLPRLLNTLGWLHLDCGDIEQGRDLTTRALAHAKRIRHAFGVEMHAFCLVNLADSFLVQGDLPQAKEIFDEAQRLAESPSTHEWMKWRYTLHLHASLAEYWLARGDHRRALESAERSLAMARPTRSRKYVARVQRLVGEIARREHRWGDAERALAESLGEVRAIRHPIETWQTELALGRLRAASGRREDAAALLAAARLSMDAVSAKVQDPSLRAGLRDGPRVRRAFEAWPGD